MLPRGRRGVYLGVDGSQTLVFDISTRKLMHTRNLTFIHVPMRPTFDLAHRKDKIDSWLGKMSDTCVTTDNKDFPGASRVVTDIQAEHDRGTPRRSLPTRGNNLAVEGESNDGDGTNDGDVYPNPTEVAPVFRADSVRAAPMVAVSDIAQPGSQLTARELRSRSREAAAPRTQISEDARRKLIMEQNIQDVPSPIVSASANTIPNYGKRKFPS